MLARLFGPSSFLLLAGAQNRPSSPHGCTWLGCVRLVEGSKATIAIPLASSTIRFHGLRSERRPKRRFEIWLKPSLQRERTIPNPLSPTSTMPQRCLQTRAGPIKLSTPQSINAIARTRSRAIASASNFSWAAMRRNARPWQWPRSLRRGGAEGNNRTCPKTSNSTNC